MYIIDGIAYAGEKVRHIQVWGVRPMDNHRLWLRLSNGEARVFDFKPYLKEPAFVPLADEKVFREVYIDFGAPAWLDGEIDIGQDFLHENSIALDKIESA